MSIRVQKIVLTAVAAGCVATMAGDASTGTDHGFFWQCYVSGGSASISFPSAGTYPGNFAVTWSAVRDVIGKQAGIRLVSSIGYNIGSLNGSYNNFSIMAGPPARLSSIISVKRAM